jgi:hypothetical protein
MKTLVRVFSKSTGNMKTRTRVLIKSAGNTKTRTRVFVKSTGGLKTNMLVEGKTGESTKARMDEMINDIIINHLSLVANHYFLSCRDNMLVENQATNKAPSRRDGMWMKMNSLLFDRCKAGALLLTRRSEDATPSESVYLLDCFTTFAMTGESMTTTITNSSLRGTKQSSMWMKMNSLLFDRCKAGALLLTRRSEDATPSEDYRMSRMKLMIDG